MDGYVYVECNDCSYKGLVSLFIGETADDITCSKCGSNDVEVY